MRKRRRKPSAPLVPVTVVTPSLPDRADMLAEAIRSVAEQTHPPAAHLIAVDHRHVGPGPLLNQLIRTADTEWLSILADDDLYDPDHLETLASQTEKADVVLSWSRIEGSPERHSSQYRGDFDPLMLAQRQDTGMRGTFMFRKSLWERLGGWPEEPMDDWKFLHAAATDHARFAPVYRETWTYRFHGGNLSEIVGALAKGERPHELYFLKHYIQ